MALSRAAQYIKEPQGVCVGEWGVEGGAPYNPARVLRGLVSSGAIQPEPDFPS